MVPETVQLMVDVEGLYCSAPALEVIQESVLETVDIIFCHDPLGQPATGDMPPQNVSTMTR